MILLGDLRTAERLNIQHGLMLSEKLSTCWPHLWLCQLYSIPSHVHVCAVCHIASQVCHCVIGMQ